MIKRQEQIISSLQQENEQQAVQLSEYSKVAPLINEILERQRILNHQI